MTLVLCQECGVTFPYGPDNEDCPSCRGNVVEDVPAWWSDPTADRKATIVSRIAGERLQQENPTRDGPDASKICVACLASFHPPAAVAAFADFCGSCFKAIQDGRCPIGPHRDAINQPAGRFGPNPVVTCIVRGEPVPFVEAHQNAVKEATGGN